MKAKQTDQAEVAQHFVERMAAEFSGRGVRIPAAGVDLREGENGG